MISECKFFPISIYLTNLLYYTLVEFIKKQHSENIRLLNWSTQSFLCKVPKDQINSL